MVESKVILFSSLYFCVYSIFSTMIFITSIIKRILTQPADNAKWKGQLKVGLKT